MTLQCQQSSLTAPLIYLLSIAIKLVFPCHKQKITVTEGTQKLSQLLEHLKAMPSKSHRKITEESKNYLQQV